MQDFSYARGVFSSHLTKAGLCGKEKHKVVMELGPGESLFSALLSKAYGFERSILVDVGDFSLPDLDAYKWYAQRLSDEGMPCLSISECNTIDSMLSALNSQFLTCGLLSLKTIPNENVDFIFSHAVLEHVGKNDFRETVRELWRILKPGGISTHVVDFKDHLEQSINHLRFGDRIWESEVMAPSGFYTNRIQAYEMARIFQNQGFKVEILEKKEWANLPVRKRCLALRFREMADMELKISDAVFRLHKITKRS